MASLASVLAGLGMIAVAILLTVLGLLSRRLGRVTRASPTYIFSFVAAFFILVGVGGRFWVFLHPMATEYDSVVWILVYNGAPAFGLTLGVIVAWHYWSWLLAERD